MKISVGMSGGVDSSAVAALLKESGDRVIGVTLVLCGKEKLDDAKNVCNRLEIEHKTADYTKEFSDFVIDNFISEYELGRTPNPCVVCNNKIKFGVMLDFALENGCEKIATGHYAKIIKSNGRFLLEKAADPLKDQSYFLYSLNQHKLSRCTFPLGEYTKTQVREIAASFGFSNAKSKDSQDICFVPDKDYAKFISDRTKKHYEQGNFTDKSGNVLGTHGGIINYTVGQRKGLKIALGRPVFVTEKIPCENRIVLGDEDDLFYKTVEIEDVNYIPFETLNSDMRVSAKLRYKQKEQPAAVHPISPTRAVIEFDTPQRAPAAGQSAVFYDGNTVVGGGIISKSYR